MSDDNAMRFNAGKPPVSLIAPRALLEIARVYELGVRKYARDDWRKGMSWNSVLDSLLRHVLYFEQGQDFDEESGLPHMAHAAWNAITLLEYMHDHPDKDDRYKNDDSY